MECNLPCLYLTTSQVFKRNIILDPHCLGISSSAVSEVNHEKQRRQEKGICKEILSIDIQIVNEIHVHGPESQTKTCCSDDQPNQNISGSDLLHVSSSTDDIPDNRSSKAG